MQSIFSTDDVPKKQRFQLWRDVCEHRLIPMSQKYLGDDAFQASISATEVGSLGLTSFKLTDLRAETTRQTLSDQGGKPDQLFLSLVRHGTVRSEHNGRSIIDRSGDFSIRDPAVPWAIEHKGPSEVLAISIPRVYLENILGSSRIFAGITVRGEAATSILARSFVEKLLEVERQLTPEAADRMSRVAIDLIAASVAEQMASEPPKSLHRTLIVQRAKAFVEKNLTSVDLDPPQVAAAMGVSLRHLQYLFREQGQNVAGWIWQRRLEMAARLLSDPAWLHVHIGEVAYGCGFTDQAHFSRRFRDHYDLSPREYRQFNLIRPIIK